MSIVNNEQAAGFSWLDAHPTFVIVMVGPDMTPFGIQKDFLCAKSTYYRKYFVEQTAEHGEAKVEYIVELSEVLPEVFGLAQNFMYTGKLSDLAEIPAYDVLIATWKLGHQLEIEGLCEAALEAMKECRRVTQTIPSVPLLIQVWRDTPEGSAIRSLLLMWAAEYIRSSESRNDFSKSLPQELLSDLVVAMSHFNSAPVVQVSNGQSTNGTAHSKNVHYLDTDESVDEHMNKAPKHRHSDVGPALLPPADPKPKYKRKARDRVSLPNMKPVKSHKTGGTMNGNVQPTKEQKLHFCADLLLRMLSGPGFWTRLVGPFREAVNPVEDRVPDYPDKVSKPMDLGTIKRKMDDNEYDDADEFASDVRQIFENVYSYWTDKEPIWATCLKFQKTFEEKYAGMNKWISKMDGEEPL